MKEPFCQELFQRAGALSAARFAEDAGLDLMKMQADKYLENMIRHGSAHTLVFILMTNCVNRIDSIAAGILAERIMAYPATVLEKHFTAVMWGESALLPDPVKICNDIEAQQKIKSIWDEFWPLRGSAASPPGFKHAASVRALGALGAFFSRYGGVDKAAEKLFHAASAQENALEKTLGLFTSVRDPFWEKHDSFTSDLSGSTRPLFSTGLALGLASDAAAPFARAYAGLSLSGSTTMERIEHFYFSIPKHGDDSEVKTALKRCFGKSSRFLKSAASRSGALHLYNTCCVKNSFDCEKCVMKEKYSAPRM